MQSQFEDPQIPDTQLAQQQFGAGKNNAFQEYLAAKIFGPVENFISPEELESRYPARENLEDGARITRFSPSPTGYLHLGGVYMALINSLIAKQSGGVFFVRLEDTDRKRQVADAIVTIADGLEAYGLLPKEGLRDRDGLQEGEYGPYIQSQRINIYQSIARKMLVEGLAYPCFCSDSEISDMRATQQAQNIPTGYYGEWAKWRDASEDLIKAELDKGTPFVLRFRAPAQHSPEERISWKDTIRDTLTLPVNRNDIVLLKEDGIPTYHLAHVIDDHFMRTTHVIRGEEWIPSVALHLQLFESLDWQAPNYGHTSSILKLDGGAKRKLSKRKDPEARADYFLEQGVPAGAVIEYLINIIDSGFEDWRIANPEAHIKDFSIDFERFSKHGALFDQSKLDSISRRYLNLLTDDEFFTEFKRWSKQYNQDAYQLVTEDPDYAKEVLTLERNNANTRFKSYADIIPELGFMFPRLFVAPQSSNFDDRMPSTLHIKILDEVMQHPHVASFASREEWFDAYRESAARMGFAKSKKDFNESPDSYVGQFGDYMATIRMALCGRKNAPDLYEVLRVLPAEEAHRRIRMSKTNLLAESFVQD